MVEKIIVIIFRKVILAFANWECGWNSSEGWDRVQIFAFKENAWM